ncbi:MAG: PLP-dependent aminotransferase family protein [Pseudomonadota bacterium]
MAAPQDSGDGSAFLYQQVVDRVLAHIESGTLRPGDRLPSLRRMSQAAGVSVPTVRQAYVELERQRRIEARPQSGFYVRHLARNALVQPGATGPSPKPEPCVLHCRDLMGRVYDSIHRQDLMPLGIANPTMARPATKALQRTMKRVLTRAQSHALDYAPMLGHPTLRRAIAHHYFDTLGAHVDPQDICITNGAQEGLMLALKAVTSPGDLVAVESPTYHGVLELIDSLGLLAVEVDTCAESGVMLKHLSEILTQHEIRACVFSTTLQSPLGVSMADGERSELLALLGAHEVTLIEDDVYGELRFDGHRPRPAQFSAPACQVITCGSFSKTVAPGYRIGWVVMGEQAERISRFKRSFSCSSGLLAQLTLAEFLGSGDYQRHLTALRPVLCRHAQRMSALVSEHFPACTRVSQPVGGCVLWLELPDGQRGETLFDHALEEGISLLPGQLCSPSGRYEHFIRLSYGHPWHERTEAAVRWLGETVSRAASAG